MMMMMIGYLVEGVVREEEPQRGLGAICRRTLLADALIPVIRCEQGTDLDGASAPCAFGV